MRYFNLRRRRYFEALFTLLSPLCYVSPFQSRDPIGPAAGASFFFLPRINHSPRLCGLGFEMLLFVYEYLRGTRFELNHLTTPFSEEYGEFLGARGIG